MGSSWAPSKVGRDDTVSNARSDRKTEEEKACRRHSVYLKLAHISMWVLRFSSFMILQAFLTGTGRGPYRSSSVGTVTSQEVHVFFVLSEGPDPITHGSICHLT